MSDSSNIYLYKIDYLFRKLNKLEKKSEIDINLPSIKQAVSTLFKSDPIKNVIKKVSISHVLNLRQFMEQVKDQLNHPFNANALGKVLHLREFMEQVKDQLNNQTSIIPETSSALGKVLHLREFMEQVKDQLNNQTSIIPETTSAIGKVLHLREFMEQVKDRLNNQTSIIPETTSAIGKVLHLREFMEQVKDRLNNPSLPIANQQMGVFPNLHDFMHKVKDRLILSDMENQNQKQKQNGKYIPDEDLENNNKLNEKNEEMNETIQRLNENETIDFMVDVHDEKLIDNNGIEHKTTTQTDHSEIHIKNVKQPDIREIKTQETIKTLDEKEKVFESKEVKTPNITITSYNVKPDKTITQKREVEIELIQPNEKEDTFPMPSIKVKHEVPKTLPSPPTKE